MSDSPDVFDKNGLNPTRFQNRPHLQDYCLTCGSCAGSCPAAGIHDLDPRKLIRMVSLGLEDALVESRWPWICTLCGKCEVVCPMDIAITDVVRRIRFLRDRQRVPGILHQGVAAAMQTGNNLRLPKEDFIFILEDVAAEIAGEPGFDGFRVAIDKKGANMLTTIHNKLVNTHTEDLKHLWRIFHAAGEDWTVPSENWEGVNWGYFTGDDEAMKIMAERLYEQMRKLEVRTLLWPE